MIVRTNQKVSTLRQALKKKKSRPKRSTLLKQKPAKRGRVRKDFWSTRKSRECS